MRTKRSGSSCALELGERLLLHELLAGGGEDDVVVLRLDEVDPLGRQDVHRPSSRIRMRSSGRPGGRAAAARSRAAGVGPSPSGAAPARRSRTRAIASARRSGSTGLSR